MSLPYRVVFTENFGQGPLGLTLAPVSVNGPAGSSSVAESAPSSSADGSPATAFPSIVVQKVAPESQAALTTRVRAGDYLVAVNHRKVADFKLYQDLLDYIRVTPRPLAVSFETTVTDGSQATSKSDRIGALMDGCRVALDRRPLLDMDELRQYARIGLAEKQRALAWKVLLGYLPLERARWDAELAQQRAVYASYLVDLLPSTTLPDSRPARLGGQAWFESAGGGAAQQKLGGTAAAIAPPASLAAAAAAAVVEPDGDPLLAPEAENAFLTLDEDVWKDVQRTHPGLHFFTSGTHERMRRILYIYARLNPGIGYVQGMNEILAVLIYVLGTSEDQAFCEPDAFFCFSIVMAEVRDLFIRDLDSEATGVQGNIAKLQQLIRTQDPPVAEHLRNLEIHCQFYAFRWLTTLLTREFELPDAVRFWDSLLAAQHRLPFLHRACCALVTAQREELLRADFATALKALQRTSPVPVDVLLREVDVIARAEMRRAAFGAAGEGRSEPPQTLADLVQLGLHAVNAAARAIDSLASNAAAAAASKN
jgi:hypothetical protein